MDFGIKIIGYPRYTITKSGAIYSWFYPTSRGIAKRKVPYKLKLHLDKDGYERVELSADTGPKQILVHRLVAQTYLNNHLNLPVCRHLDSNPRNNNVSNLAWGTVKENIRDEIERGTHSGGLNKDSKSFKINILSALRDYFNYKLLGYSVAEIARKNKVRWMTQKQRLDYCKEYVLGTIHLIKSTQNFTLFIRK